MSGADLHMHSTASDGVNSPYRLIELAQQAKLEYIAITDHDSISGYSDNLFKYAEKHHVVLIPGIEISCSYKGREVHILGYMLDYKNQLLRNFLHKLQECRVERIKTMLEKLSEIGIHITYEEISKNAAGSIGRPHIARKIIQKKYATNMKDVFNRYIGTNGSCFVAKKTFPIKDTIDVIKQSGGFAVLAHPHLIGNDDIVEYVLSQGDIGLEVLYRGMPQHKKEKYMQIAKERNLYISGGSDFHGKFNMEELGFYRIESKYAKAIHERNKIQG